MHGSAPAAGLVHLGAMGRYLQTRHACSSPPLQYRALACMEMCLHFPGAHTTYHVHGDVHATMDGAAGHDTHGMLVLHALAAASVYWLCHDGMSCNMQQKHANDMHVLIIYDYIMHACMAGAACSFRMPMAVACFNSG